MKKNLTEKQVAFAHEYLVSQNASAAYRASKGTLGNPELWNDADRVNGNKMKKHEKIMSYLREKIMTEADELLDIQMDMIRDEDTPAAVRNDAIKDRLNRI
jgi:phage terminase small subunit